MSSSKPAKLPKSTKALALRQSIVQARTEAELTEQAARAAKAGYKQARKELKQAKKTAKKARKNLKELSRALKVDLAEKPRRVVKSKAPAAATQPVPVKPDSV